MSEVFHDGLAVGERWIVACHRADAGDCCQAVVVDLRRVFQQAVNALLHRFQLADFRQAAMHDFFGFVLVAAKLRFLPMTREGRAICSSISDQGWISKPR